MRTPTLVLRPDAPRGEWLEARRSGIGGSDIAALVGVHPYRTSLHVYLDKLGELDDGGDSAPAYWGRLLEAPVADHWARLNRKTIAEVGMWHHPDRPWQLVTVDRLVWDGQLDVLTDPVAAVLNGACPESVYEGKTASLWKQPEWDDLVPDQHQAQCQWSMGVWDLPRVHIACLIGGQRFVEATIERDQELIDDLLTVGAELQDRLRRHDPPGLEGEPVGPSLELLRKLHGTGNGEVVEIGRHGLDLLVEQQRAKAEEKAAGDRADEMRRDLWELMGDAEVGTVDGVPVVGFKNEPKAAHWRKESNSRVLRPKKKAIGVALAARSAEIREEAEAA